MYKKKKVLSGCHSAVELVTVMDGIKFEFNDIYCIGKTILNIDDLSV